MLRCLTYQTVPRTQSASGSQADPLVSVKMICPLRSQWWTPREEAHSMPRAPPLRSGHPQKTRLPIETRQHAPGNGAVRGRPEPQRACLRDRGDEIESANLASSVQSVWGSSVRAFVQMVASARWRTSCGAFGHGKKVPKPRGQGPEPTGNTRMFRQV